METNWCGSSWLFWPRSNIRPTEKGIDARGGRVAARLLPQTEWGTVLTKARMGKNGLSRRYLLAALIKEESLHRETKQYLQIPS